ncbi:MAG: YciI family protein [Symbiobacterium sp.]|uniref:YciI family protein n=1 Tax=Symbiobacterium sp. TaxID=1971213 RepID=UPI003463D06C
METVYMIRLTRRPGRAITAELMAAHYEHLGRLQARGQLVLCGPFADKSGGMTIIRAGSLAEAEAVAQADPLVTSGAEDWEVRPWVITGGEGRPLERPSPAG